MIRERASRTGVRLVRSWRASSASHRGAPGRSEEHTSELQSPCNLVCRLLLEKKNLATIQALTIPRCTRVTRDRTTLKANPIFKTCSVCRPNTLFPNRTDLVGAGDMCNHRQRI